MKIYNTYSKKKELFEPLNPGKVSIYTCGPTVYSFVHIGNIRSYLFADTLRRHLSHLGYEVKMIKNITDVGHLTQDDLAQGDSGEDKITKAAEKEKKTPAEITNFYEADFKKVEKEMNILPAHYFPRATGHIPQMIKIIEKLIETKHAYEKNGNVFFDITSFPEYGKLSGNTLENLKVGARIEEHPDKKNPWDFALWIKAPQKHILKWESPWSLGYPGWHIECSAMSTEYLGNTIDFHTGGEDNIFPHHEAEIAQTECYTGQKFVRYWLHARHLLMNGEKMSKSKGNLYKLADIQEKGFSAMDLRLLFLSSHYRSQLNFSWGALEQSHKNLQKINDFILELELNEKKFQPALNSLAPNINISHYEKLFNDALSDDLNTPLALGAIYEMISEYNSLHNSGNFNPHDYKKLLVFWKKINSVLGLNLHGQAEIPEEIKKLIADREKARQEKDFSKSDTLREIIEKKGYLIEDTKEGHRIKKKD